LAIVGPSRCGFLGRGIAGAFLYAGAILADQLFTNSPSRLKALEKASGAAAAKPTRKWEGMS
jgi:hypothetical protein